MSKTHLQYTTEEDAPVRVSVRHTTGILELNRPKALNSLNDEMVQTIASTLEKWWDDESIHRVVLYSTSERGFCAGGDVRWCRERILEGDHAQSERFFQDEYEMNDDIARFPKPYVSVINGVVMGGGMGVSMHGSHRVVTDKAFGAMPESAIGFVPDVGMTYMLTHVVGEEGRPLPAVATFLGLTGYRLTPADMLWSGIATDYINSADVDDFIEMVISESLDEAIEKHTTTPDEESQLKGYLADIEATFGFDTWAEIEAALDAHDNAEFVDMVRDLLSSASPSSLVAGAELFAANRKVDTIRKALDNEYNLGLKLRNAPDFVEGVRAVLVDKDRNAAWEPATTEGIDPQPFRDVM